MEIKLITEKILGIPFTINPDNEILEYIITRLKNSTEKFYVVTPNPENLVLARYNNSFRNALNEATVALPDGSGIVWASSLKGKGVKKRITGVDFMEKLLHEFAEQTVTVGFLGGRDGVAEAVSNCYKKRYPKLRVLFAGEDWSTTSLQSTANNSISNLDFLFVAFGSPKQELWIHDNLGKLPVKGAMGVGGAFDMVSGRIKRAPVFMRKIGLEWFWRLLLQPWRLKRQLRLIKFVYLVLKSK